MEQLLQKPAAVSGWIQQYGSPLHVVVRSEFQRNAADLLAPFKERGVEGGLFFARKANKLPWFVSAAKDSGLGVDTASADEVRETLSLGLPGERVVVTAIGKTRELVTLSIAENCLLVIDNDDELELIDAVAQSLGKKARVGLRFAGFQVAERIVFSRFGFPIERAEELLRKVGESPNMQLRVLHAHIDRYDVAERAQAARHLLRVADQAKAQGQAVSGIDLGGGIVMRYLQSREQWEEFQRALEQSARGERESFTYLNDGLGYTRVGDQLVGKPDLYPAWNDVSKERFVAAVLDDSENGFPLHREFSSRGLKLFFEPGRALLDNAGMTFANVAFRKRDTLGNLLIGVAMNRFNLRPFRAEFCSDPYVLADGNRQEMSEGAFIVGCLCSESDTIFRRKVMLPQFPKADDVIAFANTAGYLAHHLEVGTHGNPLPTNILIDPTNWQVQATR
jgi:diaminopimelate decarboxylase